MGTQFQCSSSSVAVIEGCNKVVDLKEQACLQNMSVTKHVCVIEQGIYSMALSSTTIVTEFKNTEDIIQLKFPGHCRQGVVESF